MWDDILKEIDRDLTVAIKNSINVDCSIRESVPAKMKMNIKRLLKKYGYPPDKTMKAVDIVMEQIKLMCSNEVTYTSTMKDDSLDYKVAEEERDYK